MTYVAEYFEGASYALLTKPMKKQSGMTTQKTITAREQNTYTVNTNGTLVSSIYERWDIENQGASSWEKVIEVKTGNHSSDRSIHHHYHDEIASILASWYEFEPIDLKILNEPTRSRKCWRPKQKSLTRSMRAPSKSHHIRSNAHQRACSNMCLSSDALFSIISMQWVVEYYAKI